MSFRKIAILPLLLLCVSWAASLGFCASVPSNGVLGDLTEKIQSDIASSAGVSFTSQAEFDSYVANHTLIITGSGINGVEEAALAGATSQYQAIGYAEKTDERNWSVDKVDASNFTLVVLFGGPSQNLITRDALERGWLDEANTTYAGFRLLYGKTGSGILLLAVSDERGFSNAGREGASYSPLAAVMPVQYVPAAATLLSLILLALLNIARTIFEFKALDVGRKGKKVGEGAWMVLGMNATEILAFCAASLVLGVSISWQYFGPTKDFLLWSLINSLICLAAAVLHEITHWLLAAYFGFKVEYRFWPAGSLLTIISSWLGNAFSVQGFLLEEIPEHAVKWKVAAMRVAGPLLSAFIMIFFAVLNVFFPQKLFQMIYSISALWAIAEVFPFNGLDGKDIKEWNLFAWIALFLFVAGAYIIVTFVL